MSNMVDFDQFKSLEIDWIGLYLFAQEKTSLEALSMLLVCLLSYTTKYKSSVIKDERFSIFIIIALYINVVV